MVTASPLLNFETNDLSPRRRATVQALDARLSVWGQAARDAVSRRAEVLIEGALAYVNRVGRAAEHLEVRQPAPPAALLSADDAAAVALVRALIPQAVQASCRILWVDPERFRRNMIAALAPAIEAARTEVRRRQALYRRRARLWQNDEARLNDLRVEVESMRVPKPGADAELQIAELLLSFHPANAA